ncbi:NAD(P)/FAD-dependent oxidoreductase [Nitratireductor basaltis]|uniref:Flavoprotein, family n=1 Tax=Nitratireductor basaltis TaxID=472175 RepID=A0A084U6S4_9HYPH|nr:NAD(P)/FAD-dependent oxidoreductase [Nitratireductor basaltis]KFB08660.1 Flavoprotein, family [Nitratireductor basaltis]
MRVEQFDTVILGAGAAGMMCAIYAASRGGRVLVVDHAKAPGEKIRISGGGRCNFTNIGARAENFISGNRHFAKSALGRYTPRDFLDLVEKHDIPWHEKTLGQLFCDRSAKDIIQMLRNEMEQAKVEMRLRTTLEAIDRTESGFVLRLGGDWPGAITARNFVVACGGKSIPKMGATGHGYQLAERFGLSVTPTRPALVPLTFGEDVLAGFREISGISADAVVKVGKARFEEAILFTHRGMSGPAILQISSYWREKQPIRICLEPTVDIAERLIEMKQAFPRRTLPTALAEILPKRLAAYLAQTNGWSGILGEQADRKLAAIAEGLKNWELYPTGTEGYRTAEVTLGGVDTAGLESKTMEAKSVPGLYFIGEVVDVTGWLGGYNFQWAWSSGWAAGTAISAGE